MLVFDNEGKREDVDGKAGYDCKAMGLDQNVVIQLWMQDFKNILLDVLTGSEEEEIIEKIIEFVKNILEKLSWQKGSPKRVNNLTAYKGKMDKYDRDRSKAHNTGKSVRDIKKSICHVTAALNWNKLRQINSDSYAVEITDGMKTIV